MRITPIFEDQYGHIYSRGVGKQTLFHNIHEYARMLFLILYSQSEEKLRTARHVEKFMKTGGDFGVDPDVTAYIVANRMVEVLNFCIMPNHFHITLHNITEAGISQYMQRIQLLCFGRIMDIA